jgi:Sulfotransferase family
MILLLGSPRSGTTWLGKIFDSHPDVLYRHEPDTILRNTAIPFLPKLEEIALFREAATRYLEALAAVRHPKVAASLPMFPKAYRSATLDRLHRLLGYASKAQSEAARRLGSQLTMGVPDLAPAQGGRRQLVIKSVTSLGRARLFAEACPEARIVHIVRHPCAQIASRLRGVKLRLLDGGTYVKSMAETEQAHCLGFTEATMLAMSPEEQMACQWLVQNQKILDEMRDQTGYILLNYDEFCTEPLAQARRLFDSLGLGWHRQTEDFIASSSMANGAGSYFSVVRDSRTESSKWRGELSDDQIRRIGAVIERAEVGRCFDTKVGADLAPDRARLVH